MRSALIRGGVAGLAGVFGVGLLTVIPGGSTPSSDAPVVTKREQAAAVLETVDDGDDDDLRVDQVMLLASRDSIRTRGDRDRNTRVSRESRFTGDTRGRSRDRTNSIRTPVSRDRDLSRADKTRDWTVDGGEKTRDRTPDSTNDRSRHDTRWGRN